jgi:hypothetical protein
MNGAMKKTSPASQANQESGGITEKLRTAYLARRRSVLLSTSAIARLLLIVGECRMALVVHSMAFKS